MLAAFYERPGVVGVREIEEPTAGHDDVIVRVAACGICGTDQHIFHGGFIGTDYPLIGGHETVGTVVEVGAGVVNSQPGDRVAVDPGVFCGYCFYCRRQQGNHCEHWSSIGVTKHGGFAEYVRAPKANVYQIGDLPFEEAAFIEPIACVVFALQGLRIAIGSHVLIYGAGTMGQLMLALVRHGNAASVTMVDRSADKLVIAKQRGAATTILATGDADDRLREAAPRGYDVVIDCTGVATVVEQMFVHAAYGAKLLFFGVVPKDQQIALRPYDVYAKDLEIYGSFALKFTFPEAIALLRGGVADVRPLIAETLPIARFAEALARAGSGDSMKILVTPN